MYEKITEEERQEIVQNSCPGPGACGGMYTANTMATAIEAMGMALPYSSSTPADDPLKTAECKLAGEAILNLLKMDLKPRDIMTKKAFENAITIVMVLGGSTNAVLHLIAMARAVDVDITLDDFQRISDKTPFLADLKPSGKYVMEDLQKYGGTPGVMRYLLDNNMIHGDCLTVTGKTIAQNLATIKPVPVGNPIIMPIEAPIKETGHLQVDIFSILLLLLIQIAILSFLILVEVSAKLVYRYFSLLQLTRSPFISPLSPDPIRQLGP